jgi:hypothetical protein
MCRASLDAYLTAELDATIMASWQADHVSLVKIGRTDTEARFIGSPSACILAFRGTSTLADAKTDLRAQNALWIRGYATHSGFLDAWNSIRPSIVSRLHDRLENGQELHITGHSLGGAIATLCAFDFEFREQFSVRSLYTFGSPRVFGKNGAAAADTALDGRYFRVVNSNDGVTRVPRLFRRTLGLMPDWVPWLPTTTPLRHSGRLIYLTEDGHILQQPSLSRVMAERVLGFRFDVGRDHLLNRYLEALA